MRRTISIAILTVALVITIGAMGTSHHNPMVNAQQKSETTEVKIDKFSYKFTKAGTFSYFCSVHPKMTGKVVVQ